VQTLKALVNTILAAVGAVLVVNLLGWALRTAETRPWTYALAAALVVAAFVTLRGAKSPSGPIFNRLPTLPRTPSDLSEYYSYERQSAGAYTYYEDVLSPVPAAPAPRPRSRSLLIRAVLATAIVLTAIAGLVLLLPWLVRSTITYNLTASGLLVFALMTVTLRPSVLKQQTWKTLSDVWLKLPSMSSFGIVAFGVLGFAGTFEGSIIRSGIAYSQVSTRMLVVLYICTVLLLVFAFLATTLGRILSREDSNVPVAMFALALSCAWLANLGAYTLFLDGVILSLYAHLA
jgi:hypothetical protein